MVLFPLDFPEQQHLKILLTTLCYVLILPRIELLFFLHDVIDPDAFAPFPDPGGSFLLPLHPRGRCMQEETGKG